VRLARTARAGCGMTQPIDPSAQVKDSNTESQHDSGSWLAGNAPAHHEKDRQISWLRTGSEALHAPGTRFPSRQTIRLSTLAIVVAGLAVAATGHFLAPGPVTSQITARPAAARPPAQRAPSDVPPAPVATNVTPATASDVPASPPSPALAPAAPKPDEHTLIAGEPLEHRSHGRHKPLASPPSPAPALPQKAAPRGTSSEDKDQYDTAQPAPPSQGDQQSKWHWKKTTTCDSSGQCADHYNPAPSDQ
jgi:hypothetical protein